MCPSAATCTKLMFQ